MTSPPGRVVDALDAEIIALQLQSGPLSRGDLAAATGVDPSTISRSVPALVAAGWLAETADPTGPRTPGRPSKRYALRGGHHLAVGIKIAPGVLTGMAIDLAAQPLVRRHRLLESTDPQHVLVETATLATELADAARQKSTAADVDVVGLGLCVGSPVEEGRFCRSSHIMGWEDVDLGQPVAELTGFGVVAVNDVHSLAAAHHWYGSGRGLRDVAVVTVGRGVGCGLVIDGNLYAGRTGSAGELGHVPIDPDGPL